MEVLRIEWHRTFDEHGEGYMELILDKFFPCTTEKANKTFKLVGSYEKKKCETDFKRLQTVMKKYNRMVKLLHTQMKGSD